MHRTTKGEIPWTVECCSTNLYAQDMKTYYTNSKGVAMKPPQRPARAYEREEPSLTSFPLLWILVLHLDRTARSAACVDDLLDGQELITPEERQRSKMMFKNGMLQAI
jgi:hypothetical protein